MMLCVHGHRPDKLGGYKTPNPVHSHVVGYLRTYLSQLQKADCVMVGGDLGVPQWAAAICVELKIPYTMVVPFKDFSSKWPVSSQNVYNFLTSRATSVVVLSSGGYSTGDIYKRNTYMAKMADRALLVADGSAGVTQHVHNEFMIRSKPVVAYKLPKHFEDIAQTAYKQSLAKKAAANPTAAVSEANFKYLTTPGNGMTKEQEEKAAKMFAKFGFSKALEELQKSQITPSVALSNPMGEAPVEEQLPGTLEERLAPKRVVEID